MAASSERSAAIRSTGGKSVGSVRVQAGRKGEAREIGAGTVVSLEGDTLVTNRLPGPSRHQKKLDTGFAKLQKA